MNTIALRLKHAREAVRCLTQEQLALLAEVAQSTIGNIEAGTIEQLVVMSSLESQNALLIEQGMSQSQRLTLLNAKARAQIKSLLSNPSIPTLRGGPLLS